MPLAQHSRLRHPRRAAGEKQRRRVVAIHRPGISAIGGAVSGKFEELVAGMPAHDRVAVKVLEVVLVRHQIRRLHPFHQPVDLVFGETVADRHVRHSRPARREQADRYRQGSRRPGSRIGMPRKCADRFAAFAAASNKPW